MSGRAVLALGTIYLVWGSIYLAIRVTVETVPPLLGAGVRFLAASATIAGAVLGVAGAGLVVGGGAAGDDAAWALAMLLFAAVLTAIGVHASPRLPLPEDALVVVAVAALTRSARGAA